MLKCPIDSCGRQFDNELTMIEHVKRRHPLQSQKVREQTTNQMLDKQSKITQEMNKLPKMQRVLQMSKQKKPLQFQRRSSSKQKKQLKNITENSQIKVSQIIAQSRQLVEDNTSSRKILKRPSLSKRPSQQLDVTKLPSLTQSKVKKLKLQAIKSEFNTTMIKQPSQKLLMKNESYNAHESQQSQMYSTAPNFTHQMSKKIELIRSRVKKQGQLSNRSSSKDIKPQQKTNDIKVSQPLTNNIVKKRLSSQTAENLRQENQKKQLFIKPVQRPIKKLLQRTSKKQTSQQSLQANDQLSESVYIESKASSTTELGAQVTKGFSFTAKSKLTVKQDKKFVKKQKSLQTSLITKNLSESQKANKQIESQFNWKQRTVTIRNKNLQNFTIPQDSQVEYIYITNCGMKSIDLNECFSLISLSLNNNQLSDLSFLQQTINGGYQNVEEIFLDHNKVESLSSLPAYLQLKKLSLTFNNIKGLEEVTKILTKFPLLQEVDLSFNPVRKQPNYKLAVLAVCKGLKKLDGMVVTKFDRELAQEYHKMYYDYLNILPLSNTPISDSKIRPSTAVSINYQQQLQNLQNPIQEMTEQQLSKEIEILEKMIKQTKQQYEIIQQENNTLEDEISTYQDTLTKEKDEEFNPKLYSKLCKQVQELQMLNFLQYASQKELEQILMRKVKQKGITLEMLTAA